jgi:O-methyltransferase
MAVSSPDECSWYHTFDLPDGTVTRATWDLRDSVDDYLGRFDLSGKSVLEIGPASGFLTVAMEKRGGRVVCIENSPDQVWEHVPRRDIDADRWLELRRAGAPMLFKSWWYAQNVHNCSANIVYCGVSALRDVANLLKFDVCFIGGVLQHVRYPIDVLWAASRIADVVIVTERYLPGIESGRPLIQFAPAPDNNYLDTWFLLSSTVITNAMSIFGFEQTRHQKFQVKVWKLQDRDIAKDTVVQSDHYNMVFQRRS